LARVVLKGPEEIIESAKVFGQLEFPAQKGESTKGRVSEGSKKGKRGSKEKGSWARQWGGPDQK